MFKGLKIFVAMATLFGLLFTHFVVDFKTLVAEAKSDDAKVFSNENNMKDNSHLNMGKFTLLFERNVGQIDDDVKYISRVGNGYTVYLTEKEVAFQLKQMVEKSKTQENPKTAKIIKTKSEYLNMKFVGANENPKISGLNETVTKTNYYQGKEKYENISNYGKVVYENLYDDIDLVFYGNTKNDLEYDFIVAPYKNTEQIALNFDGADNISIDADGNLKIKTSNTEIIQQKPFAYQEINGEKIEISVKYELAENNPYQISFAVGEYDKSLPLIIDPVVNYLTYIGGTALDSISEIDVDDQGNAYIIGETTSLNFHGQNRSSNNLQGVFTAKINADGTNFDYITILEGDDDDFGRGIALDSNNNAYVVGVASPDFPTSIGAFDTNLGGSIDGFLTKLNTTGNIVYSTYIGGSSDIENSQDIAIDSAGKAYVTGMTQSGITFPQLNKYQGCGATLLNHYDAYLTVVNSNGNGITYSTCIGGTQTADFGEGVAIDASNNAYITGIAFGGNFPTKNAFQPNSGGGEDAFVAKFNPSASGEASLIYSTYLGGSGTEEGYGIAVDSSGQAIVVGITGSINFPLQNAFRSTNQVNEGFVSVLSSNGSSLIGSSFIGGADQDAAFNVTVGNGGLIYVTGKTLSNNFPLSMPFQSNRVGLREAFVTKLKFGAGILSSSYLGGSGNDFGNGIAVKGNHIYVAGDTESNNLATTSGVIKATSTANATNPDGFVAKILDTQIDSVGVFKPKVTFQITQSTTNIVSQTLPFTNPLSGLRGVSGDWNGDEIDTTGTFSNGTWKVRDDNFPALNLTAKTISFGQAGDLPVVGDWNNDGIDTPGVYRIVGGQGQFLLTNSTATNPTVDLTINFGVAGDLPVGGDWNADGFDSVGVYRPSAGISFLTDENILNPNVNQNVFLGIAEDLPTAGDWDGNGTDTIGLWRPSTQEFFLSNDNILVAGTFVFGQVGGQPIAGDWDGRPLP